jgi:hypothetical protein
MAIMPMYRYNLQPGDGTRYQFYIAIFLPAQTRMQEADGLEHDELIPLYELVTGVGDWLEAAMDFVMLGICMPGSQGSYEVRKSSLRNPGREFISYLAGHMSSDVDRYTLAAVVLAAGVLIDKPGALVEAAEAMLRAPELL